jgi:hypothetical protein
MRLTRMIFFTTTINSVKEDVAEPEKMYLLPDRKAQNLSHNVHYVRLQKWW